MIPLRVRRSERVALALLTAVGTALGGCDDPPCPTSDEAVASIEALASGERLVLRPECAITRSVTVPAGAVVERASFELGPDDAITLAPAPDGAPETTLRAPRVRGGSVEASVRVVGPGRARIEGASMALERGIGIGVGEGASVTIVDAVVTGNVDPARVDELPFPTPANVLAAYGVAVAPGGSATIEGGRFARLASAGIVCVDGELHATGAELVQSRGVGLASFGCRATLEAVEVHDTLTGPGLPGMGVVAAPGLPASAGPGRGSELVATGLELHDAPGYGVLVLGSQAELIAPTVARMGQAGAWGDAGATLVVRGGVFEDNAGAGIAAAGAIRLEVHGTDVRGTRFAPIPRPGGGGADRMADAISVAQLAAVGPTVVALDGLALVDNARVGIVLDGGGEALDVTIGETRIETSGDQLGAVVQEAPGLAADWDARITRVGSAATLDATAPPLVVSQGSGAVGILMPPTIVL